MDVLPSSFVVYLAVVLTIFVTWCCGSFFSSTTTAFFTASALQAEKDHDGFPERGNSNTRASAKAGFRRASFHLVHRIPEIYHVSGCTPSPSSTSSAGVFSELSSPPHLLDEKEEELPIGSPSAGSSPFRCVVPPLSEIGSGSASPSSGTPLSLSFTLHGVNFPVFDPEEKVEWSIELLESQGTPESGVEDQVDSDSAMRTSFRRSRFVPQRHLSCAPVVQSSLFPTQLLTCEVSSFPPLFFSPNSSTTNRAASGSTMKSASPSSVWMDVFLVKRHLMPASDEMDRTKTRKYKERDGGEAITVRRRAVEMIDGTTLSNGAPLAFTNEEDDGRKKAKEEGGRREDGTYHFLSSLKGLSPLERVEEVYRGGDRIWAELGIGGLHLTLRTLLRRVFLSRLPSVSGVLDSLSLQHVRGVILYGPSGTGKTLIARTIVDILGPSAKLTIIHSTDILSKYVGESEQRLHQLFTDSSDVPWELEEEEEGGGEGGDPNDFSSSVPDGKAPNDRRKTQRRPFLFPRVIVIDELETLFVRRGNNDGSSAASLYEGITNTLLALMDGMNANPRDANVLVIGITNRVEALDPALLRPGRFEVVLEISSPDREGVEEIFFIHTAALRQHGFLASDVSASELAEDMSGFTGAEVAGVVRAAISLAMESYVRRPTRDGKERKEEEEKFLVCRQHFKKSIQELRYSTARDEDPYHRWAPPLPPPSPPALQGVMWSPCAPSQEDCLTSKTIPTSLVDYTGRLLDRLRAVEQFWRSLHPLGENTRRAQERNTVQDGEVFSAALHHSGSAGMVVIEGGTGSGKTAVVRYLHEMFQRSIIAETENTSFSSSSSPFFSRYLDCQSLLLWQKKTSIEDTVKRVVEWLLRIEKGSVADSSSDSPDRTNPASLTGEDRPTPRHVVIVLDGVDYLFSMVRSYPLLETTLRHALQHFIQSFRSASSTFALSSSSSASRLLLITSSVPLSNFLSNAMPDMTVLLPPLSHLDLQYRVLPQFLITPREPTSIQDARPSTPPFRENNMKNDKHPEGSLSNTQNVGGSSSRLLSSLIAKSYPSSLSFTTFLQLTEKALRRCLQSSSVLPIRGGGRPTDEAPLSSSDKTSSAAPVGQKVPRPDAIVVQWPYPSTSTVSTSPDTSGSPLHGSTHNPSKHSDTEKKGEGRGDVVAVENSVSAEYFAEAVHAVSAEMGLLYG